MRIIGGIYKGRTITPPASFEARPTTDFAKEGLFNILENEYDFSSLSMLDLFGGTGSISAEFISRGGAESVCVEMNRSNAEAIKKSLKSLGISTVKTVHCNVFDFLKICNKEFDIIFADPPYRMSGLDTLPDRILSQQILKKGGTFILEHPKGYDFSTHKSFMKEKKYGNVHFSFFTIL